MSSLPDDISERLRAALADLDELAKSSPAEADRITAILVADLRARRPVAVAPLSLWEPTEAPRTAPIGGETR